MYVLSTCTLLFLVSNLCRATSIGYINFGCFREVLLLRGPFSMVNVTALTFNARN